MTRSEDQRLQVRLGYSFSKTELLERALTHSSATPELRAARLDKGLGTGIKEDNEQLEFLGDAVLDMLASEFLVAAFPECSEGQLSKSRSRMVNASSLSAAAIRLNLGEHLRLGRGEEKTGGRQKPALLADAFEAIIAAVYLDGGLEPAREVLRRTLFEQALEAGGERIFESDRKSALQEFLQSRGWPAAEYRLAGEQGPDHRKTFQVEVWINGSCLAVGAGSTKKEAEQGAARTAMERLAQTAATETSE
jgi:ribonuclease III